MKNKANIARIKILLITLSFPGLLKWLEINFRTRNFNWGRSHNECGTSQAFILHLPCLDDNVGAWEDSLSRACFALAQVLAAANFFDRKGSEVKSILVFSKRLPVGTPEPYILSHCRVFGGKQLWTAKQSSLLNRFWTRVVFERKVWRECSNGDWGVCEDCARLARFASAEPPPLSALRALLRQSQLQEGSKTLGARLWWTSVQSQQANIFVTKPHPITSAIVAVVHFFNTSKSLKQRSRETHCSEFSRPFLLFKQHFYVKLMHLTPYLL